MKPNITGSQLRYLTFRGCAMMLHAHTVKAGIDPESALRLEVPDELGRASARPKKCYIDNSVEIY
jgi:hypothetical protein